MRALILVAFSLGTAYGCDCPGFTVQVAKDRAEIIFRGTIIDLRSSDKPSELEEVTTKGRTALFRVTRVWKGNVGPSFEMPAKDERGDCWGFPPDYLKVGTELLVYAQRVGGAHFYSSVCTRTQLIKYAGVDLDKLGPGQEPKKSR